MRSGINLTAFVAHSFLPNDRAVVDNLIKTIRTAGFSPISGERPEARAVSEKIKRRIHRASVFIAILTRRHAVTDSHTWTTSPWIIEEKGYSLGQNPARPIVLLIEHGIPIPGETGGLEGDLEYFVFDRSHIDLAQRKLRNVLRDIAASQT